MTTDLNGSTPFAITLLTFVSLRFVLLISSDTRDASLMDDLLPATMQASRKGSSVGRERARARGSKIPANQWATSQQPQGTS